MARILCLRDSFFTLESGQKEGVELINGLLEAERDEFLGRGRHELLDKKHDNYRNGCRRRKINFFGLGEIELRVPRDRKGEFESGWLPERKGQDPEPNGGYQCPRAKLE